MDTSSAESSDRLQQAIDNETNSLEEPAIESTRALRSHHSAFAPISRLPPEILAAIFSLLSPSAWNKEAGHLARMSVTHICRRWRKIALNYPHLWSHIDFTKLTPTGSAEFLARAEMVPLHLEADFTRGGVAQFGAFKRQLEAHISHTRHLSIRGPLQTVLERLVSPAPILEFLSLSHEPAPFWLPPSVDFTPVNLFDHTAPNLISLELDNCSISRKSPLLKGLRTLKILKSSRWSGLKFEDWLDALNEMPQLKTLVVQWASSFAPLEPEPSRTATLPSLTRFHIVTPATDCALALAHLVLPSLIWLHVDADSRESEGEDVRRVIPYIARNVNGTKPLRSILISGERTRAEVVAWTMPDADINVCDPKTLSNVTVSACLVFTATNSNWSYGVDTAISDALLKLLPVDSISTLTAHNHTRLSKEFWLSQGRRWSLLERARLVPTAVKAFEDMLAEDPSPDGPRLPSLKKLILVNFTLNALRTFHLRDMLIERVEQGVPLEVLDLRTCVAAANDRTVQLLAEIVVDVQEPLVARPMMMEEPWVLHVMNLDGEALYDEYDDVQSPWYGDSRG